MQLKVVVRDVADQAYEMARVATHENRPSGLRVENEDASKAGGQETIAKIAEVLAAVSDGNDLALMAAEAIYRYQLAEHHLGSVLRLLDDQVAARDLARDGASGDAANARRIFQELQQVRGSIVASAVSYGAEVGAKIKAASGAAKRIAKRNPVKEFAVAQFESSKWGSTREAAIAITPAVQKKAQELGWTMTQNGSLETIYRWLLAHKKSGD